MSEEPGFARTPAWDVADRMRKGLREANVGIQEIADYLGVSRNTVSTWINGRIQPSTQTLRLWAMRTGVDYSWLAYGKGETHVTAARAVSGRGLNATGNTARKVVLLSNDRRLPGLYRTLAAA